MWWNALLAAFGLIFVAELGDKTQLIILTLAARCGFRQVFLGAAAAFALLNALAVSLGVLLYEFVPEAVIKYAVGGVFLLFGLMMLLPAKEREILDEDGRCEQDLEGGDGEAKGGRGPLLSAFLLVCLMELGDKTQLSLLAIAAKYSQPLFVFLGGTLALWATSLIAALLGAGMGKYVPEAWMRRISGAVFIAFALFILLR